MLGTVEYSLENSSNIYSDSDDDATPSTECKIKSIRSAIQFLEEVQYCLQFHGYTSLSSLSSAVDSLADIQSKNLVQTSIDDFLL